MNHKGYPNVHKTPMASRARRSTAGLGWCIEGGFAFCEDFVSDHLRLLASETSPSHEIADATCVANFPCESGGRCPLCTWPIVLKTAPFAPPKSQAELGKLSRIMGTKTKRLSGAGLCNTQLQKVTWERCCETLGMFFRPILPESWISTRAVRRSEIRRPRGAPGPRTTGVPMNYARSWNFAHDLP